MSKNKNDVKIAVLGTQASGKGTQSFILSVTQGVPVASAGNLLREVAQEDSERGRTVKGFVDKGEFPPDQIVLEVMKDWLGRHPRGWIAEGFPRTVEQARAAAPFFQPDAVVYLEITDEEASRRISYRRVCSKCKTNYNIITQPPQNSRGVCDHCEGELVRRPDDTPELVTARLAQYHQLTEPLKEWYRKQKRTKLLVIDARSGMKEVAHEIDIRIRAVSSRGRRLARVLAWVAVALVAVAVAVGLLIYTGSNV